MTDLFFYGTLRDVPLLEIVLGRKVSRDDLADAVLPDHRVRQVDNGLYPSLRRAPGQAAAGVVLRAPTEDDLARLDFYEGGFGYRLEPVSVRRDDRGDALVRTYLPPPGLPECASDWSLGDWQAQWGALSRRAATEAMAYFGTLSAEQVAQRFRGIRLRAAAWIAAQQRPADPDRDLDRDVVVHAHHHPYVNFFSSQEMDLQFRRQDGTLSPVVNRGAQILGQGAVVLPYDPRRDEVLMVEQFRAPVYMGGDPAPWVWEPISGLVDPGETPEQAAHREAMEEAGLGLSRLERIGGMYSSTGLNSEFVHMYIGLTDMTTRVHADGLDEEGEDIRSRVLSFDDLMQGVDDQVFRDLPLVTAALWLARHRDRLRAAADAA